MTRLDTTINRLEVHICALAAAAAQAQMNMQPACTHDLQSPQGMRWSSHYDTLAHNLAEPALDELTTLRSLLGVLRVQRIPARGEGKPASRLKD
jgi:hypothetical protein